MDLMAGIAAAGQALSLAKAALKADAALDRAELKMQVAEAYDALTDIKAALRELQEENRQLAAENERLLKSEADIGALVEIDGYMFAPKGDGSITGYPACPTCIAKDKTITTLVKHGHVDAAQCPRCNSTFNPVLWYVSPGLSGQEDRRRRQDAATARAQESWKVL